MATQLLFSRRQSDDREESLHERPEARRGLWEEPRHVAFAVQDVVPSPQLYLHQQRRQETERGWRDPHEEDGAHAETEGKIEVERRLEEKSAPLRVEATRAVPRKRWEKPRATGKSASKKIPVAAKTQRKPGWDADVKTTSTLFDATLKKSVLFQPRAGDRLREVEEEEKALSARKPAAPSRRTPSTWDARLVKSLPAQSQSRRPQRDFVRMNMEKITGQSYETLVKRAYVKNRSTSKSREAVFDRLAAPVISKSLLRFRSSSPTRHSSYNTEHRSPKQQTSYTPTKRLQLTISSPITSGRKNMLGNSEFETLPSKRTNTFRLSSKTPSPPRRTPSPHHSSPGFRLDEPQLEERSMATRVFRVLDRYNRGRIEIDQILDGLRLLGLPATHNQVADYVYLIHEGASSSIDIEDWTILVGTLDAASRPTTQEQSYVHHSRSHHTSVEDQFSQAYGSSYQSSPKSRKGTPSPQHSKRLPLSETVHLPSATTVGQALVHEDNLASKSDEWYMQAIQRRVDEMYERAEQAVSSRKAVSSTEAALERAATAVYHLKSSLFPLVEQAELVLSDIKRRQTANVSSTLSDTDIARVVSGSDDLADMLLDDLLVDTVEELNKHEIQKAHEVSCNIQSKTLDEIMRKIEQIEIFEHQLMKDGYLLAYSSQKNFHPGLELVDDAEGENSEGVNDRHPNVHDNNPAYKNLTLPLSVVMNVDLGNPVVATTEKEILPVSSSTILDSAGPEDFEDNDAQGSRDAGVSMTSLSARTYERIEKNRMRFLKHRRRVEASLEATGMDQASVIEMLADLLLNEILEDCAQELESGVDDLTLTLAQSLI